MAITRVFEISCDVCEDATLPQIIADTIAGARQEARENGWGHSKRGDVCPDCKGKHRSKESTP